MLAALAGLLAGSIHVVSGPDHLAAIAPLTIDSRRRAWTLGLRWGLGHVLGTLAIAGIAWIARTWIAIDMLSSAAERVVGVTLIAIGVWGLSRALRQRVHAHSHLHGELEHAHVHAHLKTHAHAAPRHRHPHVALLVGVLHGMAGTSHLVAVLPALAMPTTTALASFLAGFALGSIAAMMVFASALGRLANRGSTRFLRWSFAASSSAAIAVGLVWLTLG